MGDGSEREARKRLNEKLSKDEWVEITKQYLARHDDASFVRIYEASKRGLLRYAIRCCRGADAAEDVVHEAYTRLLESPPAQQVESDLLVWLYYQVRNISSNETRRELRRESRREERIVKPDDNTDPEGVAIEKKSANLHAKLKTPHQELLSKEKRTARKLLRAFIEKQLTTPKCCLLLAAEKYRQGEKISWKSMIADEPWKTLYASDKTAKPEKTLKTAYGRALDDLRVALIQTSLGDWVSQFGSVDTDEILDAFLAMQRSLP